MSAAETAASN